MVNVCLFPRVTRSNRTLLVSLALALSTAAQSQVAPPSCGAFFVYITPSTLSTTPGGSVSFSAYYGDPACPFSASDITEAPTTVWSSGNPGVAYPFRNGQFIGSGRRCNGYPCHVWQFRSEQHDHTTLRI
jgi:hypothetical protein